MRKMWIVTLAVALMSLVPAAAQAGQLWAGGGGHGGQCMDEDPSPSSEVGVAVADNCFRPETISIEAGQTVTWEPTIPGTHTVTFADGPDSGPLNDAFSVKFRRPGTYLYSCLYHPGMVGAVQVAGEAVNGEALEVVSTDDLVAGSSAELPDAALAAAVEPVAAREVLVKIEPISALFLILIGLAAGASAIGVSRALGESRSAPSSRR